MAITGATNAALRLRRIAPADAGSYDAVVSDWLGTATSSVAVVTVSSTPAVAVNLTGRQIVAPSQALTLTATAAIPGPITYQWRRNGRAIDGATNSSYSIASATWRDVGVYQVVAANAVGPAMSASAFVGVTTPTQIRAWGSNYYGETTIPVGLSNVLAVSAGHYHSLALKADGTVAAWGDNSNGQCNVPADLADVIAIAAGSHRSMALRADGTVISWGAINYTPSDLSGVMAIAAGGMNLALKNDGTVVAWDGIVPVGLSNVVAIAAGYQHRLAVKTDGTVIAWASGFDVSGPAGLGGVVAVAAGDNHSLALKDDGTVVAWGANSSGQTSVPADLNNVVSVAANSAVSFALRSDGTVVQWGSFSSLPSDLANVFAVAAGTGHALALRDTTGDALPVITTQPASLSIAPGQPATLRVNASGTGILTYQWYQGASGNTTAPISGATKASYTTPALTVATSYWVKITDALGSMNSSTTTITVSASTPPVSAAHAIVGVGYLAGGTVTITNTVTYTGSPSRIDWSVLLPSGWSYLGSGGSDGNVKPATGAADLLEWTWATLPPSPFTFTYILNVPAGTTAGQPVTALVSCVLNGVQYQSLASVDPLIVSKAVLHSADSNGDGKISLLELTRVIELYNTRAGTVRTGAYRAKAGTEDGFEPNP